MYLNKLRNFIKNIFENCNYIVCIFAILMCTSIIYISTITNHKKYISDLSQLLYKNNLSAFNSIIVSDKKLTNSDLIDIYNHYIRKNYIDFTNNKIDENTYINNLKRIKDLKSVSKDTLISYLLRSKEYQKSQLDYSKAITLMDNKNYKAAFDLLSSITDLSDDYDKAKKKISDCSRLLKDETSKNIIELCNKNSFDDAEKSLNENKNYLNINDYNDLQNNINKSKESYFKSLPDYNSSNVSIKDFANASSVTVDNINKMDVPSETKYVIYVSTAKQTTYVFCGKKNSWIKYKELKCSTGIADSATPKGFFKVGMKGTWFFSPKYGQGGKYWTSFKGNNYLFHSVPYDSSATKILDNTLGTAASHGCIRLATEDSKFIHDVMPAGTSVIIN